MTKRKKIKDQKRKKSGRLHTTTPPVPKKVPWALIFGLIVCVVIVGISLQWFFSIARDYLNTERLYNDSGNTIKTELQIINLSL